MLHEAEYQLISSIKKYNIATKSKTQTPMIYHDKLNIPLPTRLFRSMQIIHCTLAHLDGQN